MEKFASSPLDARARRVADRLHARSRGQRWRAAPQALTVLPTIVSHRVRNGSWDATGTPEGKTFLADKLVALSPQKAALAYLLCRSIGARKVVEAGTSNGVSTIYLAAAVRDGGDGAHGGTVVGTEHEPEKVALARRHLAEAGLEQWTDVREGDLRETLADLSGVDGPVDFMLVDIWVPMALPALRLVTPRLRPGALVMCDNVVAGAKEYRDYLSYVRNPAGPFESVTIPGQGGIELSMKR